MESFRASSKTCGGSILVGDQGQVPEHKVWPGGAFNSCSPARVSTNSKSVTKIYFHYGVGGICLERTELG